MIWTAIILSLTAIGVLLWLFTYKASLKIRKHTNDFIDLVYIEDTLILEKDLAGNHNKAYKNTLPSQSIIDQYLLSYEQNHVYFIAKPIVEFTSNDVLEIHCFNEKRFPVQTIYVRASSKTAKLSPIELPQKTAFINLNIYPTTAETKPLLENYKKRHDLWIKLFKLSSYALFFTQVPLGYFMLMALSGDRFESLLNVQTISLGLTLMVGLALVNYFSIKMSFHRKYPI